MPTLIVLVLADSETKRSLQKEARRESERLMAAMARDKLDAHRASVVIERWFAAQAASTGKTQPSGLDESGDPHP